MSWDTIVGWYQEPLFFWFPVMANLVTMGAFLLFALPLTWIAMTDPAWARRYRIQSRQDRPGVVWPSIRAFLINNLWLFASVVVAWPLLRLSGVDTGPLPPWYVILGSLLLFIYLDDFLFYWFHRLMHRPWWFKRVHAWHHRIYTPWAVTGNYMHPFEYVATASIALIGPLLLGSHVVVLYLWAAFRQWEASEGHCGYAFPWSPTRLLPLSDSALHHDFHHSKVKGNFAGFLPWTDQVFGTIVNGYAESVRRFRQRASQPRPS